MAREIVDLSGCPLPRIPPFYRQAWNCLFNRPVSPGTQRQDPGGTKFEDCLIVAVDRNDTLLIPDGKTRLEPGDHIYVLGKVGHFGRSCMIPGMRAGRIHTQIQTITVVGGGEIGFHTCQALEKLPRNGLTIKLIERDAQRARWLAETFVTL